MTDLLRQLVFSSLKVVAESVGMVITELTPKNNQLVIFHGSTVSTYNESSRYLYEYLLDSSSSLEFMWITDNSIVYDYLEGRNYPVSYHRSIKAALIYLRAGIVIATGTKYPDLLGLVGKRTIKICLHHGYGPRSTNGVDGVVFTDPLQVIKLYRKYDYFNFSSQFTNTNIGKLQFLIPDSNRVTLGLPRCDHLLNKQHCQMLLRDKPKLKSILPSLNVDDACVLYSPTWRPYDIKMSFPMVYLIDFNFKEFNGWLAENNVFLFVSVHPIVSRQSLGDWSNIFYLDDDPLVDISSLLPEFDVLITDYSSVATDFMLMERPVAYVMHDYDYYMNDYGMLESFRDFLPGYECHDMSKLITTLDLYLKDPESFYKERSAYLKKYYDVSISDSCKRFSEFIESVSSHRN